MKNETIFIGQICQVTKVNRIPGHVTGLLGNDLLEYFLTEKMEITGEIIDTTILRKIYSDTYIDLITKKKYKTISMELGKLFIREETLIPINKILPEKEKGKNITRRKVLKRFKELKNM